MVFRWLVILSLALGLTGCKDSPQESAKTGPDPNRGRRVYLANCTACHNADPAKEGSAGPPVKGASKELLEEKVLRSTYPAGYKPKRKTSAMPSYPHVKSAIPDLTAYLQ
jgi:mono/diheme cytochrome c family protein